MVSDIVENPGLWLEAARCNGHGAFGLVTIHADGWIRLRAIEIGLFQASPQSKLCRDNNAIPSAYSFVCATAWAR